MDIRRDLLVRNLGLSLFLVSASACGLDAVKATSKQGSSTSTAPDTQVETGPQDSTTPTTESEDTKKGSTATDAPKSSKSTASSQGSSRRSSAPSTSSTSSTSSSSTERSSVEDTSSTQESTEDTNDTKDTGNSSTEPEKLDCSKLEFSGFDLGDVPNSASLVNSDGEQVELRDYCNETLVVMSGVPN